MSEIHNEAYHAKLAAEITPEFVRQWIIELRSGNWKQGKGTLFRRRMPFKTCDGFTTLGKPVDNYCCLGVATAMSEYPVWDDLSRMSDGRTITSLASEFPDGAPSYTTTHDGEQYVIDFIIGANYDTIRLKSSLTMPQSHALRALHINTDFLTVVNDGVYRPSGTKFGHKDAGLPAYNEVLRMDFAGIANYLESMLDSYEKRWSLDQTLEDLKRKMNDVRSTIPFDGRHYTQWHVFLGITLSLISSDRPNSWWGAWCSDKPTAEAHSSGAWNAWMRSYSSARKTVTDACLQDIGM